MATGKKTYRTICKTIKNNNNVIYHRGSCSTDITMSREYDVAVNK